MWMLVYYVRPALDLCDKEQVKLFKLISDEVAELTVKYGGLLWGEHGKGVRSHYGEKFFTPELWQELRYVKFLFDPNNRLNPGKSVRHLIAMRNSILSSRQCVRTMIAKSRFRCGDEFKGAMNCNGNGLCFNFDEHSIMFPSMKVSKIAYSRQKDEPRWCVNGLRLMANENVSPDQLDFHKTPVKLTALVERFRNSVQKWRGEYDFSHEVKAAMDTCLACKACASQCPIKIDVPSFRAKFFHFYHSRYLRPAKDHLVANLEVAAPIWRETTSIIQLFHQTENYSKLG